MKRFKKGFSLVELLMVVIILGILAAIAVPQMTEASKKAQAAVGEPRTEQPRSTNVGSVRVEQFGDFKEQFKGVDLSTKSVSEIRGSWAEFLYRYGTRGDLTALAAMSDDQVRGRFENYLSTH